MFAMRILWVTGAMLGLTGCQTAKADLASLVKDVEAYHRDLLFERYDVAAKRITPSQRMEWLQAIQSQHLSFAEIDIVATEACPETSETGDKEKTTPDCTQILSQMQWYSGASPVVSTGRVLSTWQYDREAKAWFIVEQEQQ